MRRTLRPDFVPPQPVAQPPHSRSRGSSSSRYHGSRHSKPLHAEEALRTQEHALRAAVAERGGIVVDTYADAGFSGQLLDRPVRRPA